MFYACKKLGLYIICWNTYFLVGNWSIVVTKPYSLTKYLGLWLRTAQYVTTYIYIVFFPKYVSVEKI